MKTEKIVYFDYTGKSNTEETLKLALERAKALGLKDIVVASTKGDTGVLACEIFKGFNVIVVTYSYGFKGIGVRELTNDNEKKIQALGGKIFMGMHAFSSVERAVKSTLNTVLPIEMIANALGIFGKGTKVCVEIVMMAADAGLIPHDKDVVAIGGTGRGADTALVISPVNGMRFFDMTVKEIICKPRTRVAPPG